MRNENHLNRILDKHDIDRSFIDHSISYEENKRNLHKLFGINFAQIDYSRKYKKYNDMTNNYYQIEPIIIKPKPKNRKEIIKAEKKPIKLSVKKYMELYKKWNKGVVIHESKGKKQTSANR
jgi:hypothetical protein